ncbi:UDP-glycosyltransferase 86A1-like [Coffea eugenioides]|uniref:UDP-glycosyltransferase 86A1-like n=1 Tax=Coffea eugenioides TaxID=49369 RepID=UPI000F60EBD1|nr:UDP-glycosyltransferase 86A1-like [Coffea eugenioides]
MDCIQQKPHAILVCFPLQGHLNPAVQLAIKLASKGFTITFINTQSIHHQITSNTQKDNDEDIFSDARKSGLDIHYTTVSDGLPLEFDRSLNHDQFMAAMFHVFSAHIDEAVQRLMESGPPVSCLIADSFLVQLGRVAKKHGLLYASFWTQPATVFTIYYHLDLLRLNGHFDCIDRREDAIDYIPGVQSIEPKDLTSYLQEEETNTICHQITFKAIHDAKKADFVLSNNVHELELQAMTDLRKKVPFYAIGPLLEFTKCRVAVATSLWSKSDCTQWLDTKPTGSVLYISFGSYAHVTKNELQEIADGVKLSQVTFVWVLRPDIVSSNDSDPLPKGFREETGDRGMIIPWCFQNQVLSHPAIGGFFTQCGWSSILESIWYAVPLMCFPLIADQPTNRKLVVDWKIGINLCDKSQITKLEVSEKINILMKSGNHELKNIIKELRRTMEHALSREGSSERNMDQFINDFHQAIQKKTQIQSSNCIS